MYYIEMLRTWRVLRTYLIVLAGLLLLGVAISAISPHVNNDSRTYSLGGHAVIVAFVCLLFASIAGSSLSRHLDHLDFALTKPSARAAFVARILGIDALGLILFFIVTSLALVAAHIVFGEAHGVVLDAASWFGIAIALGGMFAWYALVQALSCTRASASWALAGIWVAAMVLSALARAPLSPGPHALFVALNIVNPIAYFSNVPFEVTSGPAPASLAASAIAIYIVAGIAALVAALRWQRIEV